MFLNHITCTDMHFQYNGFLFGVLFISVAKVFQSNYLFAGFLFACLLNLKHIFLCLAPVYFVFILLHYCFQTVNDKCHFRFDRFLLMGLTVCSVFSISIGPWVYMGKFQSLLSRLFPFHRGLCHAYWAPNFWALYNTLDKLLDLSGKFPEYCMGKAVLSTTTAVEGNFVNMTSGLTGDYVHACLPTIRPLHTAIITLIFVLPSLLICKRCSNPSDADNPQVLGCILLRAVAAAAWAAFLFSWHVHEKAILMVTLPLLLLAVVSRKLRGLAFYVTTLAHFSLLPLIFTSAGKFDQLHALMPFLIGLEKCPSAAACLSVLLVLGGTSLRG
uniref:Alpha-1,3-glucosyltransferase n=1 Tax=Schistocephalus solidus TaxID=70667 RepID=A0A0X3NGD0_SCHSO